MALKGFLLATAALTIGGAWMTAAVDLAPPPLPQTLPDPPVFAGTGPTPVPLELSTDAPYISSRTEGRAGANADMAGMMAVEMAAEMEGWGRTAAADGWWDDPATWGGGVPLPGETVLIPAGRIVWIRMATPPVKFVQLHGFLGMHPEADALIEIDTVFYSRTGMLWFGDAERPVTGDVEWRFPLGDIDLAFDARLQSRGVMGMGRTRIHGAPKTPYLATDGDVPVTAGATSLTLAAAPLNWNPGDEIAIWPVRMRKPSVWGAASVPEPGNEAERRVLTAVNGAVLSWAQPLLYDHTQPAYASIRYIYIVNMTRNLRFCSPAAAPVHQRGHVMPMFADDCDIRYAEFANLGRTDKRADAWDFDNHPDLPANGGAGMTPASNIKGRYGGPHIHICGPDNANIKVAGCSVHDSFSLGIVWHQSNVDALNNSACFMWGSGLFNEAGNEAGLVDGFCGIAMFTTRQDISNKNSSDAARHDWGHAQMFWMQSRVPVIRNVFVAGCSNGAGPIWNTRGSKPAKIRPKTLERRGIRDITYRSEFFFNGSGENLQPDYFQPSTPPVHIQGLVIQACLMSGQIEKSFSQQNHMLYSHIKDVAIINCGRGWHFEYTARYLAENFDTSQQPAAPGQDNMEGFAGDFDNGIREAIESYQFTIRNHKSTGYNYGTYIDHVTLQPPQIDYVPDANWHMFIITPALGSARTDLVHPTFANGPANSVRDTFIDESELDLNPAYPLYAPDEITLPGNQNDPRPILSGMVTDSLGTRQLPAGRDTGTITNDMIWGWMRGDPNIAGDGGFWTETGTGRCFTEVRHMVGDGGTAAIKTVVQRVYLTKGSFSGDPRGGPDPGNSQWINGPWANNGSKA